MHFCSSYSFFPTIAAILSVLLCGCYQEQVMVVDAGFRAEVVNNNYSVPVQVKLTNTTAGAETYAWSMPGSDLSASSEQNPGTLTYSAPGTYTIRLDATNPYGGSGSRDTTFTFDAAFLIGFLVSNPASWYPDATAHITNSTVGATSYQWTFEGGTPASSTQQQPGDVVFSTPGKHTISLKASNSRVTYTKDTTVTVLPDLTNDFSIVNAAPDNSMEVPFSATLQNNSAGATATQWSIPGGSPISSAEVSPVVRYTSPGTYTITLKTANDKKSLTSSKSITLIPNGNLYTFNNIHLGINTAQNSIGCYFSAALGKVLKTSEVTEANGSSIDIVFFGFDSGFTSNRFVSPSAILNYTFGYAIPNATTTRIINRQESCGCSASLSSTQFDGMTTDALLSGMDINQTTTGLADFDNSGLPRVVLFQTQDGRKGAIKVKQCVQAGLQSYIVCDIKVMKIAQ